MTEAQARRLLARASSFMAEFAGCFGRASLQKSSRQYIRGLLSDKPRKSMQPMVDALTSDAKYQSLQHFITHATWDWRKVWTRLRQMIPSGPGLLLIDDTGFPKQGKHSVGVARQYSGTLGKVGNCQIAVASVFAQKRRSWPIGFDLYLPKEWMDDRGRCRAADVPDDCEFLEKWRIALKQVDRARRDGVLIDVVVADAGYGDVYDFREGLRDRQLRYLLGVKGSVALRVEEAEQGPNLSAQQVADDLPSSAWKRVAWRNGTKGVLQARFAAVRVRAAHDWTETGPWPPVEWLLCERSLTPGERSRYYLSNLPRTTRLERLCNVAHERWRVEEHFQRLKSEVSIDHFEGRSWTGWHHHTALAAVTYALLEAERIRRGSKQTFEWVRAQVRRLIMLMMLAEKNEDAILMMSFRRRPPSDWTFG